MSVYFITIEGLAHIAIVKPPKFTRLPTGAIKPTGWARDQAQIQADGLGGHLQDFDS